MQFLPLAWGALTALALLACARVLRARGQSLLPLVLEGGAAPLGYVALRLALDGGLPSLPPHDATDWWVFGALGMAALAVVRARLVLLILAAVTWWFVLAPYREHHWTDGSFWPRSTGLLLGSWLAATAGSRSATSPVGWVDHLVLSLALGAGAALAGHTSGSVAMALGVLAVTAGALSCLALLSRWRPGLSLEGEGVSTSLHLLAWGVGASGVLYASIDPWAMTLLGAATFSPWLGGGSGRAAWARLGLALLMVIAALALGWPEPDPYAAGWS